MHICDIAIGNISHRGSFQKRMQTGDEKMMCNKQWPKGKLRCIPPHLNLLQKNTTAADTTYLQLLQCESPPFPNFGVVFECWASYDWPQGTFHWTRCNLGCFLETFGPSSLLLPWLVEPGLHIALPMLFKVSIGDYTVPFGSHNRLPRNKQEYCKKIINSLEGY